MATVTAVAAAGAMTAVVAMAALATVVAMATMAAGPITVVAAMCCSRRGNSGGRQIVESKRGRANKKP